MHASIGGMKIAMSAHPLPVLRAHWQKRLVLVAAVCCAGAMSGFGAALDGGVPGSLPVEWLGAVGVPHAAAFNVFAFLLPGAAIGVVAVGCYLRADTALARIGALILLFSALAFACQGVFPLDPRHADVSSRRHALSWSLWWLTTATGASLSASGLRPQLRTGPRWAASLAIGWCVPAFALFAPSMLGAAMAQKIAYALWFAWWWLASGDLSGNAVSAPGSSRPAGR